MNSMPASQSTAPPTTATPASVVQTSTVSIMNNSAVNLTQQTSNGADTGGISAQIDNAEINEAVTKVLQGYDWTFAPLATK